MPSSAVAPQNGQEPVEGFAVDAAADARPGPVLHVAARRGGAGQFHRQARPHWCWILAMIVQMLLTLLAIVLIFAVILGGFAASLSGMSYGMY